MPEIVMICGQVACLKTTLAYRLSPALGYPLITTFSMGEFHPISDIEKFNSSRNERYSKLISLLGSHMQLGLNCIIEGTFSNKEWRENVYDLISRDKLFSLKVIFCTSSSDDEVKKRLDFRKNNPDSPDAKANSFGDYSQSKNNFPVFLYEEIPDLFEYELYLFDSSLFSVKLQTKNHTKDNVFLRKINSVVSKKSFRSPFFDESDALENNKNSRIISVVGIPGAGKSTLIESLKNDYESKGKNVIVFDENTLSGFYGYESGKKYLDHKIYFLGEYRPAITSIYMLASRLDEFKKEIHHRAVADSVIIFDGSIFSNVAHVLSTFSVNDSDQIRKDVVDCFRKIFFELYEFQNSGTTFFLEIPVSVSKERLKIRDGILLDLEKSEYLGRLHFEYQKLAQYISNLSTICASKSEHAVLDIALRLIK